MASTTKSATTRRTDGSVAQSSQMRKQTSWRARTPS
jgi:hypothetical protein